jgi:aminoglycoside phosphotransferase (APT) family kinase protein
VELPALVERINAHHGTSYALRGSIGGTHGTWLLEEKGGGRAVLKRGRLPAHLEGMVRLDAIIEHVRARGYPTPRFLHYGADADGRRYTVQELAPGRPLGTLSPETTEVMLELNARHADMHIPTTQDWARYVYATVYEGDLGWAEMMRTHSRETAVLWDAFRVTAAPYRAVKLWDDDLVHSDFHEGQVLMEDGRVSAVVDFENAGKGSRVQDLMTLLMYAYFDDLVGKPIIGAEEVRRRLWDYALDVRGPGEMVICTASSIIGMVEWSVRHDAHRDADAFLESGWRFLADLAVRTA